MFSTHPFAIRAKRQAQTPSPREARRIRGARGSGLSKKWEGCTDDNVLWPSLNQHCRYVSVYYRDPIVAISIC